MLKEELQLLQEPGSYVGEVVKVMGKSKVLVKVSFFFVPFFQFPNPYFRGTNDLLEDSNFYLRLLLYSYKLLVIKKSNLIPYRIIR